MTIKTALLSVSDKTGLVEFATFLAGRGVKLLSTGGTAKALRDAGLTVVDVSEHTGFPEIMDGRVKTLHPLVHGGLLAVRSNAEHVAAMKQHNIAPIDLVVINLYPFEKTVAAGAPAAECIENIDIGGPSMIRSAAKNHADVTVIVDTNDYKKVMEEIAGNGATTLTTRTHLAAKAYSRTAAYDSAISGWFVSKEEAYPDTITVSANLKQNLRYGENPHQKAAFYVRADAEPGIATAVQLQGKELSYNNINDTNAAFELVGEFSAPTIAIIKHANPSGVAQGNTLLDAYEKALACDPVSAFGGIIAANRTIDAAAMTEIAKLFVEVIIAPDVDAEARAIIEKKKNVRLLITGGMPNIAKDEMRIRSVSGGFLLQDKDTRKIVEADTKCVSKRKASKEEIADMLFAFTVAKHVKSNAIVLAKDLRTLGIGAGQMSRVDSVRIATIKAGEARLSTQGAVLASDAFFPFDDNVHNAAKAGIAAIIQPGGSIRDEEIITTVDSYDMAMVFTGIRHFNH